MHKKVLIYFCCITRCIVKWLETFYKNENDLNYKQPIQYIFIYFPELPFEFRKPCQIFIQCVCFMTFVINQVCDDPSQGFLLSTMMINQYCPNFLLLHPTNEHNINRATIKIEVVISKTTQKIPLFFHNRISVSFLSNLNLILDRNISIQYVLKQNSYNVII